MAGGPVSTRRSLGAGGNYQSYLNNANKIYGETLQGYQTALSGLQGQQAGINAGYNQLQANVLSGLEGSSASASQEVADRYTAMSGKATQDMISRGLGNTTIQSAVQRGIGLDESKAQTDVHNKFAHTAAGYQTQLGLAGLGYRGAALGQQLQLQGQQLGYMGSYSQQQNQLGLGFANAYNGSIGRGGGGGGGSSGGGGMALRGAWGGPTSYGGGGGSLPWSAQISKNWAGGPTPGAGWTGAAYDAWMGNGGGGGGEASDWNASDWGQFGDYA
jgi:hypothetical protein